ncbi:MAG: hypothetical protein RRZ83_03615 [Alistipes sp.]
MKKIFLLVAICAVGWCTACSDDDEAQQQGVAAKTNVEKLLKTSYWYGTTYFLLSENGEKKLSEKSLNATIGNKGLNYDNIYGLGLFNFSKRSEVLTYRESMKSQMPMSYGVKYAYTYDDVAKTLELKEKGGADKANWLANQSLQIVEAVVDRVVFDSPLRDEMRAQLVELRVSIPLNVIGLRTVCSRLIDPDQLARCAAALPASLGWWNVVATLQDNYWQERSYFVRTVNGVEKVDEKSLMLLKYGAETDSRGVMNSLNRFAVDKNGAINQFIYLEDGRTWGVYRGAFELIYNSNNSWIFYLSTQNVDYQTHNYCASTDIKARSVAADCVELDVVINDSTRKTWAEFITSETTGIRTVWTKITDQKTIEELKNAKEIQ